ncbi:MAG: two-component system sensor histidine kinase NtrB [Planctomycetota bacterium]
MGERPDPIHPEVRIAARLLSLLRLLLLALALAVVTLAPASETGNLVASEQIRERLAVVFILVALVAVVQVMGVRRVRSMRKLALHVAFDVLWVGYVIYLSGGVVGPGVPLLFAVVLGSNLILPGRLPFMVPVLASAILGISGVLYLAWVLPAGLSPTNVPRALVDPQRIVSTMVAQIGALVLVDLLAQYLGRRLHEERVLTDELLDHLGEGVLVADRHGRVLYSNSELLRLLDIEPAQNAEPRIDALFAGESLAPVRELFARPGETHVLRLRTAAGRSLSLHLKALYGRRGRRVATALTVSDESALRALEREAERSERLAAMGEMAAGIAHEVRNPLASLRGCAQELEHLAERWGKDDAVSLTRIMIDESDRVGRIIEDFLRLARTRQPEPMIIAWHGFLTDIERQVRLTPDLPAQLELQVALDPATPGTVHADEDHLRQICLNLLGNAIDAVREVGAPWIRVQVAPGDESTVVLAVSDNGCGMPPEIRERAFTPFVTSKSRGTGLGLALVHRLVTQHGGEVGLRSEPGAGTTVRVVLPQ